MSIASRSWIIWGCLGLVLGAASGCSTTAVENEVAEKPAKKKRELPSSYAECVAEINKHGETVAEAFTANNPEEAHDALHKLGWLLTALPEVLDKTEMPETDRQEAKDAGRQLFDAYDKLDQLLHGDKEEESQAAAKFEEIKESIASATVVLDAKLDAVAEVS